MKTFENQYNLRVANQIKVISALKNGPMSLNDLADKLNVSFTAISKIIDQMIENGIVKKHNKKAKNIKRGRTPTFVKLDTSHGVTAAIDLANKDLAVVISDFNSKVVVKELLPWEKDFTEDTLRQLSDILKRLLKSPEVENRPLCGICISSPGMVHKTSGEMGYASKIKTHNKLSPLNFFFNEFGVPTHLYNDVKIGMVGEKIYGCIPTDAQNYMFIHIGASCGFSFAFDGRMYQGKNGFCGELSNYKATDDFSTGLLRNHLEGYTYIAEEINKQDSSLDVYLSNNYPNKQRIAQLYAAGNPIVVKAVEHNIEINAAQIIAYNDMLDLEYIIIEGAINDLGPKYKESLLRHINEYDFVEFRAKILFSSLDVPPSTLGAIYQANNIYFLNRLEQITNERCTTGNYDISETFGSNI